MNPFIFVFAIFFVTCILERLFPNYILKDTDHWFGRALLFNFLQLLISSIGSLTWERSFMNGFSIFNLSSTEPIFNLTGELYPYQQGLIGYVFTTWVFYWWHLVRHESYILWLLTHQFHHSPERIEVITSFYKHPLEIFSNSVIIAIISYPILGISLEGSAWLTVFSGLGEIFYHMNIKTPYWIGYFIQRPENHCEHHLHDTMDCKNYSDFPIWDMLGGTFHNTERFIKSGFSLQKENRVMDMMMFKDVIRDKKMPNFFTWHNLKFGILMLIGCLSTIGLIFNSPTIRGIGFMTGSSPLPFVFSHSNGYETFSTTYDHILTPKKGSLQTLDFVNNFDADFTTIFDENNNMLMSIEMDHKFYENLDGPYNRRNMIGVILSYGPFFDKENMIEIRDQVLNWGLCEDHLLPEVGIDLNVGQADIIVHSKTKGNEEMS